MWITRLDINKNGDIFSDIPHLTRFVFVEAYKLFFAR